jgi:hypothetical protein
MTAPLSSSRGFSDVARKTVCNCPEELPRDAIICPGCAMPTNFDLKQTAQRAERKHAVRMAMGLAIGIALMVYLIKSLLL